MEAPRGAFTTAVRTVIVIFTLALAIRLLHLWQLSTSPFSSVLLGDARAYDAWAQHIAAGDWIGRDAFYQAPLYPYLLGAVYAVAGRDLTLVRVLHAVGGAAACVLLASAGTRLFSRRIGITAGLILALYPPAVFFDGLVQKTAIDALLVCAVLHVIARIGDGPERLGRWLALGVLTAALCLTRENALVFIPLTLIWTATPWTLVRSRQVLISALFLAGVAALLVPVAVRNAALGGGFSPTTAQSGPNLFIGNNADANGTYRPLRAGRGSAEFERADATDLAQRDLGRSLTPREVSRYWTARAVDFVVRQPGAWITVMARKAGLLVNRVEVADTDSLESHAEWSTLLRVLGPVGHFGVLLPLAALGLWMAWPPTGGSRLVLVMAASYALSVLVFYVVARYRHPLAPFVILWAAAGLTTLPSLARSPRAAHRPVILVALVVGVAVAANWPLASHTAMQAISENALGSALFAEGRSVDAAGHFRRAISLAPDDALAYVNLGVSLQATGRSDEARAAFSRAAELRPDLGDARYFLGKSLAEAGRTAEALPHLRAATAAMSESLEARTSLGLALAAEGRFDEAVNEFRDVVQRLPGTSTAHWNLGSALASAGRYRDAIKELDEAMRLDGGNAAARRDLADAHNRLGITFASAGAMPEAIAEFQQALRVEPGFADAERNLAIALQRAPRAR